MKKEKCKVIEMQMQIFGGVSFVVVGWNIVYFVVILEWCSLELWGLYVGWIFKSIHSDCYIKDSKRSYTG